MAIYILYMFQGRLASKCQMDPLMVYGELFNSDITFLVNVYNDNESSHCKAFHTNILYVVLEF